MIKLSVIVPIFNSAKTLEKCLDSILNQDFKNFELICINDGSRDNSLKILNEYKKKDNRIIVIDQQNRGLSATRNVGIKIATGDYVTFIDSDDYIENITFSTVLECLEKNYDVVRIEYNKNHVKHGKEQIKEDKEYKSEQLKSEIVPQILRGNIPSYSWLLYINVDKLKKNNWYFNETTYYMEDIEYLLKICYKCDSIFFKNAPLYNYVINLEGMTKSKKNYEKNMNLILDIHSKVISILKENDINFDEDRKITDTIYANNILNYGYLSYRDNNEKYIFYKIKEIIRSTQFQEMEKNFKYNLLPLHLRLQLWFAKNNKFCLLKIYFQLKKSLEKLKGGI